MAQSPIPFMSRQPAMAARKANGQQFIQNMVDRNKVEKARMEQIKSLKQIAKGYGASSAQVESSSFGELQGFVKRLEIERADETREQETRQREMQMRQSQQAMLAGADKMDREAKERQDRHKLFSGLLASPGPSTRLTPEGETLTSELEGYESAAQPFLDSMKALGMSPEKLAEIEQGQAAEIASFHQRLAGPSMRIPQPSSAEQMFPGRPQVQAFLRKSVEEDQDPELAFGMAAKMAAALPSRETGLLYARGGSAGTGQQPYFFSESDAIRAYNQMAASQSIPPTKAGREAWVGQTKIIDLQKLRTDADRQIRNADLGAKRETLIAYRDMKALFKTGNPLGGTAAKEKLARMLQPVGILTDSDIVRYGGSEALSDRIDAAIEKITTGNVDEDTEQFIKEVGETLAKRAAQDISEGAEGIALDLRDSYGISEADVWAKTPLDELSRLIPPGLLPAPGGAAPTAPTPTTGRTTIPGTNTTFKRN